MKRTLCEILCGLAVVVTMVSFNQRVSRLQAENLEIEDLRQLVRDTAAKSGSKAEIHALRQALLAQVGDRLRAIQEQIEDTQRGVHNATFLKDEIEATKRQANLLRAELTRDVQQARDLIGTYQDELRTQSSLTRTTLDETARRVEEIATAVRPDPLTMDCDLLAPTVQLNGDDTVGSGTLIRSELDPASGVVQNDVITSYHVVRNIYADTPTAKTDGIAVTVYKGDGRVEMKARMIAYKIDIDAALLRFESSEPLDRVARVLPRTRLEDVRVWDDVYALGCPLGNDPIPTHGELSSKDNVLNGTNYWMINAPTYYGNSGGGVYRADGRYLIGVFSKIYTHGKGNPIVVPHMGLCTPITAIYDWLDEESLGDVIPQPVFAAPGK